MCAESISCSSTLNACLLRRHVPAHEERNTDNAFVTNHCYFSRFAILCHVDKGNHGSRREIHVGGRSTWFKKHLTDPKLYRF